MGQVRPKNGCVPYARERKTYIKITMYSNNIVRFKKKTVQKNYTIEITDQSWYLSNYNTALVWGVKLKHSQELRLQMTNHILKVGDEQKYYKEIKFTYILNCALWQVWAWVSYGNCGIQGSTCHRYWHLRAHRKDIRSSFSYPSKRQSATN